MKVGLVYTSTTPELIALLEREVRKNIGERAELISLKDASILAEVREAGYVTPTAAARLMGMYVSAVAQGAEAILNVCSSVGEVADAFSAAGAYIGVPVVRIDEEMCRQAVRLGARVGVLATLSTTLAPTRNTLTRVARAMGKHITLTDGLADGAFGLDPAQFRSLMIETARSISDQVDVIVLAQGSMAYVEKDIEAACGKPTLSSPRFGAAALRDALCAKGCCI
ncbi:MAG: aspartate/glutamate racemase family protein [Clostridia bacterium]